MTFPKDMLSGGVAGFVVDISLFPIDTVKTRLQAKNGFIKSGGFNGIYRGLGIVSAGSIPGSAVFFSIYEGHGSTNYTKIPIWGNFQFGEIPIIENTN